MTADIAESIPVVMVRPTKWRCALDGWNAQDFLQPEKGYSHGFPAQSFDWQGKEVLYHSVISYPDEKRYALVAGYRASHTYVSEGKRFANVDLVLPEEYESIRKRILSLVPKITEVYFYCAS